ncbi:hypothetical protein HD806DRAFT_474507 [Xylariaceae sp. AK1471]|nr:hypothetical protein HD806DRAFT_474507 [Xylariaceae sp. AK1471]
MPRKQDIEAQKPTAQAPTDDNSTAPSNATSPTVGGGVYARSGRGGAGNFATIPSILSFSDSPYTSTPHPPSLSTPSQPPRSMYSGRGGAGNWASEEGEETKRAKEEQERRRKEALDAGIAQEIRASLPQPPRTYHLHGPGRGRKPEADLANS